MRPYEGKRGLRWVRAGSCLVTYVEENKLIDDGLWDTWLAAVQNIRTETVMLCGWGPIQASTAQWRQFTNIAKTVGLPIAVVTDARHNAALAKKAAWVGANVKSFKWDASLYEPFVFLGFDLETRKALKPKVFDLRDVHGAVDQSSAPAATNSRSRTPLTDPMVRNREMPAWMREDSGPSKRPSAVLSSIEQQRATSPTGKTRDSSKAEGLAADIRRARDNVFQSSSDIQAKLAEVQARLRARNLEMQRRRGS